MTLWLFPVSLLLLFISAEFSLATEEGNRKQKYMLVLKLKTVVKTSDSSQGCEKKPRCAWFVSSYTLHVVQKKQVYLGVNLEVAAGPEKAISSVVLRRPDSSTMFCANIPLTVHVFTLERACGSEVMQL